MKTVPLKKYGEKPEIQKKVVPQAAEVNAEPSVCYVVIDDAGCVWDAYANESDAQDAVMACESVQEIYEDSDEEGSLRDFCEGCDWDPQNLSVGYWKVNIIQRRLTPF